MPLEPLNTACLHFATPQEKQRDPDYRSCNAAPGQPCTWAKRYDGLTDPPFHSERLESAAADAANLAAEQGDVEPTLDPETFRQAILDTGLV